ncbi:hypothetical protein N5F23_19690 [Pseudomonas sichuanensis]|uniref:hypothetical protein n=1 Tax=Pseudomonas sichuanensis TaxID=2213015 RepID=UPI00244D6D44|nr:hypothetical protein [Pseudomonas sichuanensis]MDH0732706.1 hypothetical protein [Pseudomonas sichuanensis]MDH1584806.1 hypothetical protein [Pseudomonas sichuanensis]MDH1594742.1 hypothetical protein [Pseudomonas sichuanensis]MDH1600473.1 hypothetical protein [Pseudomonas sichuanensis]
MNKVSAYLGTLVVLLLAGCSGIPSQPYQEPSGLVPTARMRVISNSDVFGDSITGRCAPSVRHTMVQAGHFLAGRALENHPQFPLAPAKLGMPQRLSPPLLSLTPTVRNAEGRVEEVVAEYRVPTTAPFQLATLGAGMGTSLGRGIYCDEQARVYNLEAGRDYEVTIGMGAVGQGDNARPVCRFDVRVLMPIGQGDQVMPMPVTGFAAPRKRCD